MTKRIIKLLGVILISIVAILILLTAYTAGTNKTLAEEKNKSDLTLGQMVDYMNELRDLKEECANNLGIADSARFLQGYTGYCDSWDAEIIELREKINQISKKDYEGLM